MPYSYNIATNISNENSQALISGIYSITADAKVESQVVLAANEAANKHVIFNVPKAQVKAVIVSTTANVVVKVNSSTSPANTVSFQANSPSVWVLQVAGQLSPLHENAGGDVDVTDLYITKDRGVDPSTVVTVTLLALYDSTP